ncbi:MAG: helix-turn-helix domain-containing protein, partial [Nitriliruptorales bacterium]|nr:helix-turn-helix domain-containing protein [Nitriliruptorales bacterium]
MVEASEPSEQPNRPPYPIESVGNALQVLLLLRSRSQLRVAECAREVGVARSTAHRLLAMLDYYGFVRRDPDTRAYRAGPALLALGLSAVHSLDIRRQARPHMERLAESVGETVNLMVLEGGHVRFVDGVESPRALRVGSRIGLLRPAHCTSAGKAMLATLPPDEVRELYPDERLTTLTERSIATRSALEAELATVRERGYALNVQESNHELIAVGVAIPH